MKIENKELNFKEKKADKTILRSRPHFAWVAFTNRCNLKCLHCPRDPSIMDVIDMDARVYEEIKREIFPYLETCEIGGNNYGEQLIYKDFGRVLEDLNRFGVKINLTTNGVLLNDQIIEDLVRNEVNIFISIEGINEIYEKIRGVSWEKIKEAILRINRERQKRAGNCTKIGLFVTVFADNIHQLPQIVQLAEIGIDTITVQHLLPKNELQKFQSLGYHRTTSNYYFAQARKLANQLGITLVAKGDFPIGSMISEQEHTVMAEKDSRMKPCDLPWTSINILENGDITPCCAGALQVTGNLRQMTFEEIWNGAAYQKLRKTVNTTRPKANCRNCSTRNSIPKEESLLSIIFAQSVWGNLQKALKGYLIRHKKYKLVKQLIGLRDYFYRIS